MDLAHAIAPTCEIKITGIRPGEKLHEVMVPEDDAYHTVENDEYFVILPTFHNGDTQEYIQKKGGKLCPAGFRYSSDTNTRWLSIEELRTMIGLTEADRSE